MTTELPFLDDEYRGDAAARVTAVHLGRKLPLFRLRFTLAFGTGLALALISLLASAVHLGPRGLGQVLVYPYYTVRSTSGGTYNTLLIVTNTAADTKVIRIRFRESRNGREVAGFNVFLVPFDSWTGAIVPGMAGPELRTTDGSCTDPALGTEVRVPFSNAQYAGINADGEETSLDRAAEGYVEVYEMGVVADATLLAALAPYRGRDQINVPNCVAARAVPLDNTSAIVAPTGGLMGSAFIVNVADGTLYSYDATALDDFSRTPLWTPATNEDSPTLADVNPKISEVFAAGGYRQSNWDVAKGAQPADPVSAILMQDHLLNYFVLDYQTQSATDWIVTMPTKPFYVQAIAHTAGSALRPFESTFAQGGASDYFGLAPIGLSISGFDSGDTEIYDREAAFPAGTITIGPPLPTPLLFLPWAANVLTFNQTNLFGSPVSATIPTGADAGWLRLAPYQYQNSNVHRLISTDSPPRVYFGLPMIGFMANDYVNGTLPESSGPVLSNYGATSPHKGTARIE